MGKRDSSAGSLSLRKRSVNPEGFHAQAHTTYLRVVRAQLDRARSTRKFHRHARARVTIFGATGRGSSTNRLQSARLRVEPTEPAADPPSNVRQGGDDMATAGTGEKRAEIYTYEAPWLIYALGWSVSSRRPDAHRPFSRARFPRIPPTRAREDRAPKARASTRPPPPAHGSSPETSGPISTRRAMSWRSTGALARPRVSPDGRATSNTPFGVDPAAWRSPPHVFLVLCFCRPSSFLPPAVRLPRTRLTRQCPPLLLRYHRLAGAPGPAIPPGDRVVRGGVRKQGGHHHPGR